MKELFVMTKKAESSVNLKNDKDEKDKLRFVVSILSLACKYAEARENETILWEYWEGEGKQPSNEKTSQAYELLKAELMTAFCLEKV